MAGVVDPLIEWLNNAWESSNGVEGFKSVVRRTLQPADSVALAAILQFGDDEDAYLAQIALRMLGGDSAVWRDQEGTVHYRVVLGSDGEELFITPEVRPTRSPSDVVATLTARQRKPMEVLSDSFRHSDAETRESWEAVLQEFQHDPSGLESQVISDLPTPGDGSDVLPLKD
jgi:hypothetical protein